LCLALIDQVRLDINNLDMLNKSLFSKILSNRMDYIDLSFCIGVPLLQNVWRLTMELLLSLI